MKESSRVKKDAQLCEDTADKEMISYQVGRCTVYSTTSYYGSLKSTLEGLRDLLDLLPS